MKIFVDSEGREFELSPYNGNGAFMKGELLIRPVEVEPKYKVTSGYYSDVSSITITVNPATKDQAQLIKVSVNNLMEYLTDKNAWDKGILETLVAEARQSMRENN